MRSIAKISLASALAMLSLPVLSVPAFAQDSTSDASDVAALRDEVASQKVVIGQLLTAIQQQQQRIDALERSVNGPQAVSAPPASPVPATQAAAAPTVVQAAPQEPAGSASDPVQQQPVGEAPDDFGEQPEIAALGRRGSAITRQGQLSGEVEWSYARADRNRALFRGIEVVESVLIGVFDINESRQDVFTQTVGLQYGLTDSLEVGIDVPVIARWNTSILAPVAGSTANDAAATVDNSAEGYGLGDVEILLRKQILAPRGFGPYLIGNLQVDVPTGEGPFAVRRNEFGEAFEAATGSGFWGVTPGLTAILPSDPGVLFGTLSYTKNFARDVNTVIPPVRITRVDPGDALSFSAGLGLALNPRLSLNFGYAHSWGFGTETTTLGLVEGALPVVSRSRDLQIGRLLFGTTYKLSPTTSFNFGVEAGVTDDAGDVRVVMRFPFSIAD